MQMISSEDREAIDKIIIKKGISLSFLFEDTSSAKAYLKELILKSLQS